MSRGLKTVLLEIDVPRGQCCAGPNADGSRICCEFFDNDGGHGSCDLDIGVPKFNKADGYWYRPATCINLRSKTDE